MPKAQETSPTNVGLVFSTTMGLRPSPHPLLTVILLACVAGLTWLVYSPGFKSAAQFDDHPNLASLEQAQTRDDVLSFIFEGKAGPLGRPLSLASFAIQRDYWPNALPTLIKTNTALHILAGFAAFILALGIARALKLRAASWVALLAATLWLLSPFLASTSLMLIQRMSILAGFFVFAGLAAYVWGRIIYQDRPNAGLWLMASGIIIGTAMATLSKENGALLPAFALVIEVTILGRQLPPKSNGLRVFHWIFLILPSAAIGIYLALRVPDLFLPTTHREFTPLERAASQPAILWEYFWKLVIPTTTSVTPFTDDRQAVSTWTDLGFLVGSLVWFGVVATAVVLRHRIPILLFSVSFFLAGHVLESTIVNLELYYAHRNYVPAFAVYLGIAAGLVYAGGVKPRLVLAATLAYALIFGTVLLSTASLWGNPLLAAEIWARQHDGSQRAHQFLANQYFRTGDAVTAKRILEAGQATDSSGSLVVQGLFTCVFPEPRAKAAADELESAAEAIRAGSHNRGMGSVVLGLTEKVVQGHCSVISPRDLEILFEAVQANPAYQNALAVKTQILNAKALVAQSQGDRKAVIDYAQAMYELSRHANHARFYSDLLVAEGRRDEALEFLHSAKADKPKHPVLRRLRNRAIDQKIRLIEGTFSFAPPTSSEKSS
jgi:protein O-mannosyl-transferase